MGSYLKSAAIIQAIGLAFLLLFSTAASSAEEKSGPLVLEHADQLISSGENSDIVNLIGNVHFSHDKADIFSNRATWYRKAGLIQFIDSVRVIDENRQITAKTMTYYRRDRRVTAMQNVKMVDLGQDAVLFCQRVDYYRNLKQFDASGNPELTFNPRDDTARMVIASKRMSYFAEEKRGVAIDSVVITRNTLMAKGGYAEFFREPERVILTTNPLIVQNENELSGDSVSIFTENRRIKKLLVRGDARALYRTIPDTALHEFTTAKITGRELEAFFENDKISEMITRRNATSYYDPAVTDTLVRGANTASGDSIILFFDSGLIRRVLISGGAQGEFVEPKFNDKGEAYFDTTRYSASTIDYKFADAEITLTKNGKLNYQDMELDAGEIRYNTETKILIADHLPEDSSKTPTEPPILKQGSEELFGERMSYNLDSRRGQVKMARTQFESGFYAGRAIRQASKDVLFVSDGDYTSCDKPVEPHYIFHSKKMKMIGKDKVIGRPVILYIGRLPVFALPYYVFPIRKGRHSGILPFDIGNFERGERFIKNVGYYWAASEYWDLTGSLDFYENSRTAINGGFRYAARYRLNGNMGFSYTRKSTWDKTLYVKRGSNQWRFNFLHNQTLSQTMTLKGSGSFYSDKSYIDNNVFDPSERLNRTVTSNLSLSKRWVDSPWATSLNVTASQTWYLDTDVKNATLPSINYSRSSLPLFPNTSNTKKKVRIRPGEEPELAKDRFYNSINMSLSSSFQNVRNRLRTISSSDTAFIQKNYQTMSSQVSLTAPQKIFGILTVGPSMNLYQNMVNVERNKITDSLGLIPGKIVSQERYTLSIGANTSLYGTVAPNLLGVAGLRHVMTPSATYSFTPEVKYNRPYMSYAGLGGYSGRSKTLSFGLANLFQTKYLSGETEKKLDLFSLNFGGSYNFAADSLRLSPISTSLRTGAIPKFNLEYSASHSFYEYNRNVRRAWHNPRLTNQSISASTSFSYKAGGGEDKQEDQDLDNLLKQAFAPKIGGAGQLSDVGFSGTLNYSYSESRALAKTISQKITMNLDMQPTRNWAISYFCYYDIKTKRIESQSVNIRRDMHCWQADFSWVPSGAVSGYYLKISIKAHSDIKIEKSEGISTSRGGSYF